jgi:hypothetical protein
MATWSSKRKFIYAVIALVIVAVAIVLPAWKIFYVPPSCTDNKQDGDEQGVDCGGSCTVLCQNSFLTLPPASWVRFVPVAPDTYNVAAYMVNPNPKAGAKNVPYTFELIDANGLPLAHASGTFDLAPGRNSLAFAGPLVIKTTKPVRAVMTVDADPIWSVGNDPLPTLLVADKSYGESTTTSRLTVTLKNTGALPIQPINVYAILDDASGNAIDFSRTIVDGIRPGSTAIAPFTWPHGHSGKVISIEVLSVPE